MKKTLLTIFAMTVLTFAFSQEMKQAEHKTADEAATVKTQDNLITLKSKHIKIDDRLDLEADSAQYDLENKTLTSFGTKRFTFSGKVAVHKETRICKFYLDTNDFTEATLIE